MQVVLFPNPVLPPTKPVTLTKTKTILEILRDVDAPEWFMELGVVSLNGHIIERKMWKWVKVKHSAQGVLDLYVVPEKGRTLALIATLALVAVTTAISFGALGPAGLELLGASFAAGGFGASLAAAGLGLVGNYLIAKLTAPSQAGAASTAAQSTLQQAGIQANPVTPLQILPIVFGKVGFSPPHLMVPYTIFTQDETRVVAVMGFEGRNLIENVLINGLTTDKIPGLVIETREGTMGDTPLSFVTDTVIEVRQNITLSEFKTVALSDFGDNLKDQDTPANSIPKWHYFKTEGSWDKFTLRLLFPSGIVKTDSVEAAMVPVRVEVRKVGDAAWRAMPTCHVADYKKGIGPVRCEIRLIRGAMPGGRNYSSARDQFALFELTNITGIGQSFEYRSDDYFIDDTIVETNTNLIPFMTGYTTSGVTITASSEYSGSNQAWKCWDASGLSTVWAPAYNTLPAWLKVDLGADTIVRSYVFRHNTASFSGQAPTEWTLEGSTDNVTWVDLNGGPVQSGNIQSGSQVFQACQVGSPAAYRYYRFTFTKNNGSSNEDLHIAWLQLFANDSPSGTYTADDVTANTGFWARHYAGGNHPRCMYGTLDENGANFYLDQTEWPSGEYEVRMKRGVAEKLADFNQARYAHYGTETANADYFEYRTDGSGRDYIYVGQRYFKSDMQIELVQTQENVAPFDPTGLTLIAISVPNTQVNSVYAEFTSYAPTYDVANGIWTEIQVPTSNPASLYRALLLGKGNADPTPGEIIDEDELADWFQRCVTKGFEANLVSTGRSIGDVKKIIATCGYASPRDAHMVGVVQDYDRSALPGRAISPLNSRNLGMTVPGERIPEARYIEYVDAADEYKFKHEIIYRKGFDINTATYFDTQTYEGFTDATKTMARAQFDLDQLVLRGVSHKRQLGIEGYLYQRGEVVLLNDDVLDEAQTSGIIQSVQTSGPNVISITLNNLVPFSIAQQNVEAVQDMASLTDILNISQAMGVVIRLDDGSTITKTLSDVTDSNVCTFTTPFTYAGSGLAAGQLVLAGVAGKESRRMIVMDMEASGFESRTLILADEANELFA